jgi:hypothetical protein
MARKRGTGIPGLSFSWRRALGVVANEVVQPCDWGLTT